VVNSRTILPRPGTGAFAVGASAATRRAIHLVLALLAALALCAALARPAGAAGFSLYEQGARALGTAGAFTARADDPSAMFFNPAGLAHLDGRSLVISPNLIYYKSEFSGVAPFPGFGVEEETKGEVFPPFALYYGHGIDSKVAAGIGVYSPYGLQVAWKNPDQFTGRTISTFSRITPFYFVPTVAWAPSPAWRLGAGANLVLSTVELRRHLQAFNPIDNETEDIGTVELDSHPGFGAGFNAGIQWWPDDRWRLGATYRSEVDIDYEGPAVFTQLPTGNPAFDAIVAATFPPDQRVETAVAFPAQASLGIARVLTPAWTGEVNFNWTQWSAFDRLDLVFPAAPALNESIVEDWDDAINIRAGLEYRGAGGASPWAFRGGYYFDQSPQPTEGVGPLLPDADRHGFTAGLGWRGESVAVDAFALLVTAGDRSTEGINRDGYDGTYSSTSLIAGASLGLTFR
jgi:long-chain fatty acid transport protein